VPSAPEPPEGSPESIRIFRAGRNFYLWSLLEWAFRTAAFVAVLAIATVAITSNLGRASSWAQVAWMWTLGLLWVVFAAAAVVTFIARRLRYRLHWYIVTDRSLRIRSGVFQVDELTMTYGNIQEIRVIAGPLQHLLGLADVEVQTAGGGGDQKQRSNGHTGRFEGLSNADAIRDLIQERLRQYRDSGLGDAPHRADASERSELDAARELLEEARALRAALAGV
jgi:membrane protein YdbS with pleckstrin-like domain